MNWNRLRLALKQVLHWLAPQRSAEPLAVSHPVLGELAGTADELHGSTALGARSLKLTVRRDDQAMETTLALAEQVIAHLPALHERSLRRIADGFLVSYNDDWRVGQTVDADGRRVRFENPALSAEAFCVQFALTTVEAGGCDVVALWYDCGELFWGHGFCVTSFDGVAGELHAEMLG
ncbi:DUF2262 domain-containing protein [Roseateles sp. DXS20W]|uniref:DUF2262 domain-containing protein n=1 Tax=Pelomonas lactea TaxID=3299030 RepID=A0ABW7GQE8_9BURK